MARRTRFARRGPIGRSTLAAVALVAMSSAPARALLVAPYFAGHALVDATHPLVDPTVQVGFQYYTANVDTRLDIDVDHGLVDDGGIASRADPGDWSLDYDEWAPLIGKYDLQAGGAVTYGQPAPGVFAVTWVNVPARNQPGVRNTFQVVFVGATGYHTNTGVTIPPGSVVYAYGSPSDPRGTVHYSSLNGAAIGTYTHGVLTTLQALGVGDSLGVLSDADTLALQNSGDPFLFATSGNAYSAPLAFDSVPELGGTSGVADRGADGLRLAAGPNPVRGGTTLTYTVPRDSRVRIVVRDPQGRRVATLLDAVVAAGSHAARWNALDAAARRVPPGVYLVTLEVPGAVRSQRLAVVN